jgi:hypothetical protein
MAGSTWADTKDAPKHETIWEVRDRILYGGKSTTGEWVGTWLLSDQERATEALVSAR